MTDTITLQVPMGYRRIEKTKHVHITEAEKILTSKKKRYYTRAVRNCMEADLFSSHIVCPHCSHSVVSNTAYAPDFFLRSSQKRMITQEEICAWATRQLAIEEDITHRTLVFSAPITNPAKFLCPSCNNISVFSEESRLVELRADEQVVSMKNEIVNPAELLDAAWYPETMEYVFPMYEILEFDLGKGNVYVRFENANGDILCRRDITRYPDLLGEGISFKMLSENKIVRRHITRMFKKVWGGPLPYDDRSVNIQTLFLMTMFVGYRRDFYDGIPFLPSSLAVESGFSKIAEQLHNAEAIVSVYADSGLPQTKALRKIFFENPALFFYLEEAKQIYDVFKDINYLYTVVQNKRCFTLFSELHVRPGILFLIRDYCADKGVKAFLHSFDKEWDAMLTMAVDYCCMSKVMRAAVRRTWVGKRAFSNRRRIQPAYSIPMCTPQEHIRDCSVEGFDFAWLRNSNEYMLAGTELENCLVAWEPDHNPVVCVKHKDRYVAAIEVSHDVVVQAFGALNAPLEDMPGLAQAVRRWMSMYRLRHIEDCNVADGYGINFDELDFDDLDFDLEDIDFAV